MRSRWLLMCCTLILSGCVNNVTANRISHESYANKVFDKEGREISFTRVFAWDAKYSAGIGNSNGVCAQGALTAEASSVGAAIDAAAKVANAPADPRVKASFEGAKAVTGLNATNAQTSFANIGYFYICQLALNSMSRSGGGMSDEQIVEMFEKVTDTAPKITSDAGSIASAKASQIEAFKKYIKNVTGRPAPEDIEDQIAELEK